MAVGGHARTLPADQDGPREDAAGGARPASRCAPGTDHDVVVVGAGHNGLVTAAYLARGRAAHAGARGPPDRRRHRGQRAVRRRHGQHLQLRPHHVPHDAGDGGPRPRRPRAALPRHGAGADGDGVVGRAVVAAPPRRRADRSTSWPRPTPTRSTATAATCGAARPAVELILAAATEPPSVAGLTRARRAPPPGRRADGAALEPAQRGRRHARRTSATTRCVGPALVAGPMVWGISPETPGTGLGALTYAMRHVGRVGRPVGGSGALTEALRAAVRAPGGAVRTRRDGRPAIRCDGDARRRRDAGRRDRDRRRRSSCRRATRGARSSSGCATRRPAARGDDRAVARRPTRRRATSRRSTPSLDREPRLRDSEHRLSSTLTIAPTVAEMDRGGRDAADGRGPRAARRCSSTCRRSPTRRWRRRAATCSASRCC